jgi:hypothetical protein
MLLPHPYTLDGQRHLLAMLKQKHLLHLHEVIHVERNKNIQDKFSHLKLKFVQNPVQY